MKKCYKCGKNLKGKEYHNFFWTWKGEKEATEYLWCDKCWNRFLRFIFKNVKGGKHESKTKNKRLRG